MGAWTRSPARLVTLLVVCAVVYAAMAWRPPGEPASSPSNTSLPDVSTARPPQSSARPSDPPATRATVAPRDLGADERRGGHTLARHVGKSDEDLRARLVREPRISAASTYTDRDTAQRVVAEALAANAARLRRWTAREGRRPNLALDYEGPVSVTVGRSIRRGQDEADPCHDAVVVLKWDENAGDYYVLTSYPEVRP